MAIDNPSERPASDAARCGGRAHRCWRAGRRAPRRGSGLSWRSMHVVALDVETANSSRGSICALSVVSRAFGARTWLVRPEPCYFAPVNVGIHGITEEHVANTPRIHEVFAELAPLLQDVIVVAHNASFDIGALVARAARAPEAPGGDSPEQPVVESLAPPDLDFTCSLAIARRAWPNLRASTCTAYARRSVSILRTTTRRATLGLR